MNIDYGMDFDKYKLLPRLNASTLKSANGTAADYFHNKKRVKESSRSMIMGTLFHALFLEGKVLFTAKPDSIKALSVFGKNQKEIADAVLMGHSRMIEEPKGIRKNSKAYTDFVIEHGIKEHDYMLDTKEIEAIESCIEAMKFYLSAEEQDLTIVSEEEAHDLITACAKLKNDAEIMQYFENGKPEVTYYDDKYKCRCDWIIEKDGKPQTVIDLKTTLKHNGAHPKKFKYDLIDYQYDIQDAFYSRMVQPNEFLFLAVELTAPYKYGLYDIGSERREEATEMCEFLEQQVNFFESCGEENASSSYTPNGAEPLFYSDFE